MGTTFRRGFKKAVDELVREIRADARKTELDPIDVVSLVGALGIPLIGVSSIDSETRQRFLSSQLRAKFHAATVPWGLGHAIIHNDTMPRTRQSSNIAHELGHIFLEHGENPINVGVDLRDSVTEAEANWFGFALLVPTPAAFHLARIGLPPTEAAPILGVSEDLMRMRLHASGAARRYGRKY